MIGSRTVLRGAARLGLLVLSLVLPVGGGNALLAQCLFIRGDINNSGGPDNPVDLNDAVDLLAYIFIGESVPPCRDAADANDNGLVEMSDYIYLVKFAFGQGPAPAAPYPAAGPDPTPGTTVPTERDARFSFKIGDAIGFASNTGLKIPILLTNKVPINGFQMAFQYDGTLVRIDEFLPDETALKAANAEYIIHQAFNRSGPSLGGYSALLDFATPFDFHTLPAGDDQLVGNMVVAISLIADQGETEIKFVDGMTFPDEDPPERLAPVENVVVLGSTVVRPLLLPGGKVTITKAFIRGDANQDMRFDIADPVFVVNYIFLGGKKPRCMDAADANNDSRLDISDTIFLVNYLFLGGPQPSSPFPAPGVDPDHDTLDCAEGTI